MKDEIPLDLAPVVADARDYYPQLEQSDGEEYSPFGYHSWEEGSWACDGRRLHLIGKLPDVAWARLLHNGVPSYEAVTIASSAELKKGIRREEPVIVSVTVKWLAFDEDEPLLPIGAPPEGFRIAGDLLLDALDFLVGDNDQQISIKYSQGVFKLERYEESDSDEPGYVFTREDGTEFECTRVCLVDFGRTCFVAGYLGFQWELPLDESVLWRGKTATDFSGSTGATFRDALDMRVSTSYPSPLAWSYRLPLDATTATQETLLLLRASENVLAFLASLSLALVLPSDRASLSLASVLPSDRENAGLDLVTLWRGGISPGTWTRVLKQCRPILLAYEEDGLAHSLAQCLSHEPKAGILRSLDELVAKKNAFKHDRAFGSEEACQTENEAILQTLSAVYERLGFLAQHPVRLVYSIDVSEEKRCFLLDCQVYRGAITGAKRELKEWYEALPKNRIYVEASKMRWISLYPFIQRACCPTCGDVELFFIEKIQNDRTAHMKSFQRGHVRELDGVPDELVRWHGATPANG